MFYFAHSKSHHQQPPQSHTQKKEQPETYCVCVLSPISGIGGSKFLVWMMGNQSGHSLYNTLCLYNLSFGRANHPDRAKQQQIQHKPNEMSTTRIEGSLYVVLLVFIFPLALCMCTWKFAFVRRVHPLREYKVVVRVVMHGQGRIEFYCQKRVASVNNMYVCTCECLWQRFDNN